MDGKPKEHVLQRFSLVNRIRVAVCLAFLSAILPARAQESVNAWTVRFTGTAIGRSYDSDGPGSPAITDPPDRIGEEFFAADLYAEDPDLLAALSGIREIRVQSLPDGTGLLVGGGISAEPRDSRILWLSAWDENGSIWVSELPIDFAQLEAAPDCAQESGLAERVFLDAAGEPIEYQVLLYADFGGAYNSRSACRTYLEETAPELADGRFPSPFWRALTWSGALDLDSFGNLAYADLVFRFVR